MPSSSGVTLHNVAAILRHPTEGRDVFSRLPASVRAACNPGAQDKALQTAGVEIRCNVGGAGGGVKLFVAGTQPVRAELYMGDHLVWPMVMGPGEWDIPLAGRYMWPWLKHPANPEGSALPALQARPRRRFDPALLRIVLPYRAGVGPVRTRGQIEPARADQVPSRTLLAYGSSITQGVEALTAASSYAPRLAELLGMDLLNLGFGGSAHLEPEVAAHIAERDDWHTAFLELGINMVGSFTVEAFAERARHFVRTVAAAGRPVVCTSMFTYFGDLPGGDAGRARAFREAVREAAAAAGPHVRHLETAHLPGIAGLCADLLHPSPTGMESIARALAADLGAETP